MRSAIFGFGDHRRMIVTLQTQRVQTLEQVRHVAKGTEPVDFALADRASAYEFIRRTLVQFDYAALGKADKSAVKAYLAKMTGLSRAQLTRLMAQHRSTGRIRDRAPDRRVPSRGATPRPISACSPRSTPRSPAGRPPGRCCAASTRSSPMSASRAWRGCRTGTCTTSQVAHLPPAQCVHQDPGQGRGARKPRPDGQPGFCASIPTRAPRRPSTPFTQTSTSARPERFLVPVLEALIEAYPFAIRFMPGSEYINHRVARLLTSSASSPSLRSKARTAR